MRFRNDQVFEDKELLVIILIMSDSKYTEKEINWALNKLKEKHPERANREQAIKLLNSLGSLAGIVVNKVEEDKRSGKLNPDKPKIRS